MSTYWTNHFSRTVHMSTMGDGAPSKKRKYSGSPPKVESVRQIAREEARKAISKNVEWKKYDLEFNSTVADTASVNHLTIIGQGDNVSNREGDEVFLGSVHVTWMAKLADTTNVVRLILVLDQEGGGTTPAVSGIVEAASTLTEAYLYSPKNEYNKFRFKFLHDELVALDAGNVVKAGKFYHRFKTPVKCTWSNSAGTAPRRNNLYLVLISDSVAVSHPAMEFYSRVLYHD